MLLSKQIFFFYGHLNEHENMQPVPKDMAKALGVECGLCDDEYELSDLELPIAYNELRHREKIEGSKKVTQSWRMKERVCFDNNIYHTFVMSFFCRNRKLELFVIDTVPYISHRCSNEYC